MIKRIVALFAGTAVLACARTDSPAAAARKTILDSPGLYGGDIATDGRLAYAEYIAGKSAIFVSDGEGKGARRVSFGIWDTNPVWSADGKWIAFTRDAGGHNDAVIIPSDSGPERVVGGTPADEASSAWLPDGSGILFSRGTARGSETWLYKLADGTSGKLFEVDGSTSSFPSPDGKFIVYTLRTGGKNTIWVWDVITKKHRQLTTEGMESMNFGSVSPDSRWALYQSFRTGTNDIWRVELASGKSEQLTKDVSQDGLPRWSPDGKRIVFLSNRGGQPDLWIMSSTGESDVQRLTDDAILEGSAAFTRDGRGVLVDVVRGQPHLYSLPVAGGSPVALTSGDWGVLEAEVSRDGTQVAYVGTRNGDQDIWTVAVRGGESVLVSGAPGVDIQPSWSPDGKQIAFASSRAGNSDILIAPAAGGTATRLTDWPGNESRPRWSPDGKSIAFLSDRETSGADIWTIPVAGGQPTRLTTMGLIGAQFSWSPDSRSVVFQSQAETSGGIAVFTVSASGGPPKQIAPATSFRPRWSPDGRSISLSTCTGGYCVREIWSAEGKFLRRLNSKPNVYEFDGIFSANGSQILVGWQDLVGDGGNRVDIRSATDGEARLLAGPEGYTMVVAGFGDAERVVIAGGIRNGNTIQRIEVPAPIKSP
jgi:Tol biopolymer transport system component